KNINTKHSQQRPALIGDHKSHEKVKQPDNGKGVDSRGLDIGPKGAPTNAPRTQKIFKEFKRGLTSKSEKPHSIDGEVDSIFPKLTEIIEQRRRFRRRQIKIELGIDKAKKLEILFFKPGKRAFFSRL